MPKRRQHLQEHHIIYKDPQNPRRQYDITRLIRNGVHAIVTKIRRFRFLTDEEIETIKVEAELRRAYGDNRKALEEKIEDMLERRRSK
jgi:hypothetical protein